MNRRLSDADVAVMAASAWNTNGGARLKRVRRETWPGQSRAYLRGAWRGDGVVPAPTRQMRRAADREARKRRRR